MHNLFFIFFISFFSLVHSQCPSMGIHSYVLITITPNTSSDGFIDLFDYYAKLSSSCGIEFKHELRFGSKLKRTIVTDNLNTSLLGDKIDDLYINSLVNSNAVKQMDDGDLMNVLKNFILDLDDQNHQPQSVVLKKTITIITDYLNINLTDLIPGALGKDNAEAFIITPIHSADDIFNDDKFIICVKDAEAMDQCSEQFCKDIEIYFQPKSELPSMSQTNIYAATFHSDLWMLRTTAIEILKGQREIIPMGTIKRDFIQVHFAQDDDQHVSIMLPWVSNVTKEFYEKCINSSLIDTLKLQNYSIPSSELSQTHQPAKPCSEATFYKKLVADLSNITLSNGSVVILGDKCPNCLKEILNSKLSIGPDLQIFFRIESVSERNDIYTTFVDPVHMRLNQSSVKFHVNFIQTPEDIINGTVVDKITTSLTPLVFARKYTYREPWSLAIDQFIVIIILCVITAIGAGAFLYRVTKKIYIEQMAEAQEEYKEGKICLKPEENLRNDCLPWEVHIDRITFHQDFPLGEDSSSVIYLGKLKGKAPICQWINLPEMKQFQDCAVAVRVPRRYDDEEEKQLLREINAMKTLKHHDYIANLLGWYNKHNFACTILELTHTNLLKYASQIKDSCELGIETCVLPLKQYLRIFVQICDAMGYVASKGLVHRNLTARSVLLTTGLRAKISGFNYCSTVGDNDFESSKPAFYNLPIHWMSIEAMKGRFTDRSDIWSFGMLLFEVYSLGEKPYAEVRDNLLQKTIKSGNRPLKPEFASDEIYSIMSKCWHRYPERRPTFKELQIEFQSIVDRQFDNPAFVFEHAE